MNKLVVFLLELALFWCIYVAEAMVFIIAIGGTSQIQSHVEQTVADIGVGIASPFIIIPFVIGMFVLFVILPMLLSEMIIKRFVSVKSK